MTRYAQGGLTRFDTGGTHESSPIGGIPIGGNNSVEENETKNGNFVYSNRIFLDPNIVSQYNLPKSLVGKSVADATKFIDNKFKGRNDKISQSTKNGMLSKIAEAQEAMKPQEPEMVPQEGMEQSPEMMGDPSQMALGGYTKRFDGGGFTQYDTIDPNAGVGYKFAPNTSLTPTLNTSDNSLSNTPPPPPTSKINANTLGSIGMGVGTAVSQIPSGALDKKYSFNNKLKAQDDSMEKVKQGVATAIPIAGLFYGVEKAGIAAGEAIGGEKGRDVATGILDPSSSQREVLQSKDSTSFEKGVSLAAPFLSGIMAGKARHRTEVKFNDKNATFINKQFSDQYALGGEIDPTKVTKEQLKNTTILPNTQSTIQSDRFRYAVGEQGGVQHGKSGEHGYYLYYGKKPGDAGFNPNVNREFVNQAGYNSYMSSPQGQQYRRNLSTQSLQPIEQLGYGGKINQMDDGGFADSPFDEYSKQILPKLNFEPVNQIIPSFINKGTSINNAQSIIGTPVDGDFGTNSNAALNKYRQSKGMTNIGQPLSAADYTAMGLTSDGYKINKNAFRQQLPENLNLKLDSPEKGFKKYTGVENNNVVKDNRTWTGKVLSYVNDNAGNLARYAPIAANAYQLSQLKKPQAERLDRLSNRYKPSYVDMAQQQNIVNQELNNTNSAIQQSGASQGAARNAMLASQLNKTKALSNAYMNAEAQNRAQDATAQQFNLGVDQTNLHQSNTEKDINARDSAAYRNEKSKYLAAIGEGVGDIGKEQVQKKIIKTTTGYTWDGEYVKSPDGNVVTDPDTGKPMTGEKLKALRSSKDKKALGGYLIKNKIK